MHSLRLFLNAYRINRSAQLEELILQIVLTASKLPKQLLFCYNKTYLLKELTSLHCQYFLPYICFNFLKTNVAQLSWHA